ncbi:MAG: hypothetical protein JHC31_05735 [Sulfurihydrogenibium sp.]|nr:hypothetical protein [Sulfurihydrogenibium sp.]
MARSIVLYINKNGEFTDERFNGQKARFEIDGWSFNFEVLKKDIYDTVFSKGFKGIRIKITFFKRHITVNFASEFIRNSFIRQSFKINDDEVWADFTYDCGISPYLVDVYITTKYGC